MRWLHLDRPLGHPEFGKIVKCPCQTEADTAKRRAWLMEIDGLKPHEREYRFELLAGRDESQAALNTVAKAVIDRRGMVSLTGAPGTGKSTLLMCAVNAAREVNIPSIYTTMSDLLAYLRSAFNPKRPQARNFDASWNLLLSAEVLAVDELDEFSTTEWATERLMRLIDERWRSMGDRLTLLATNAPLARLPPKVASRLSDGRGAVVEIAGKDMRPLQTWNG